ncbi:MAG TPA: hypothetical protein VHE13_09030 [Opitutus sp.]|nr:hypothetical protein [Opitutus sp.]
MVTTDPERNVVRLTYVGAIGVTEAARDAPAIARALAATRPGFHLFTDLSALQMMEPDCASQVTQIMVLARQHEIGRVVRLIPDRSKDIGLNILSLFHYPRGLQIITCGTSAEAEAALA